MKQINNDIWLTQNLIAELFGVGGSKITEHINNILKDGELSKETSVGISDESTGGRKSKIYNLDMIIAVGYRVNSKKATQFRIWATKVLKEYIITGVVMDDERLKNPNYIFGEDYFERTLERIRILHIKNMINLRKNKINYIFLTLINSLKVQNY